MVVQGPPVIIVSSQYHTTDLTPLTSIISIPASLYLTPPGRSPIVLKTMGKGDLFMIRHLSLLTFH